MKSLPYLLLLFFLFTGVIQGQDTQVSQLIASLLADTPLEEDLQELCDDIGGRETGSSSNDKAVEWAYQKLSALDIQTWKQEVPVSALWLEKSTKASILGETNFEPLVVSKYHSPIDKIQAPLIYLSSGSESDFETCKEDLKGKMILVATDLCMDINGLFTEYTHAYQVEQLALKHGTAGIVFMSSRPKKLLYRFTTSAGTNNELVQIVMAREDAKRCARTLESGKDFIHLCIYKC